MVDAHRLAKINHTPAGRSPVTPVTRGSATPLPTDSRPLAGLRIPPFPLPGFADSLSLEPRAFSPVGVLPDGSPARLQLSQVGGPNFSDIEDDDDHNGSAFLSDDTRVPVAAPAAHRPYVNVVCDVRRDSVRRGRYHHTPRPYVGIDMLEAQISERRAELAFLRSTWPRESTRSTGIAAEMAGPIAVTLADPPSPDVAVATADSAIGDVTAADPGAVTMPVTPALSPGAPIASVSEGRPARGLSVPITSASSPPPPTTADTSHQGVAPVLSPSEPVASVSDGRPARVHSVQTTSVLNGRPLSSASAPPRGAGSPLTAAPPHDPRHWYWWQPNPPFPGDALACD